MKATKKDFKKIFSTESILKSVVKNSAWIVFAFGVAAVTYLSFVENFEINLNWSTIGVLSAGAMLLSWLIWSSFYRKNYEELMDTDIQNISEGVYSIHKRYYDVIKLWKEVDLQVAIDKFNEEYTEKWLRWVEKRTGKPIETKTELVDGKKIVTLGIKELPYKGFKYKMLMWRIKHHKYPTSGYTTSMEVLNLFSYNDANFNKRDLSADKKFYASKGIKRIATGLLTIITGAGLIPQMIDGEWWSVIFTLIITIGSLIMALIFGSINGTQGARKKLSLVEECSMDLERWGDYRPNIEPYSEQVKEVTDVKIEDKESSVVSESIFDKLNKV
jgi:hypothetical protein